MTVRNYSTHIPGINRAFPSPFWTAHHTALRILAAAGMTATETARCLGVSKNSAISCAQRIDVAWARSPKVKPEQPRTTFPPPGRCLFIIGDPRHAIFCGEEVVEYGHPYCPEHHLRCYRPQLPPK